MPICSLCGMTYEDSRRFLCADCNLAVLSSGTGSVLVTGRRLGMSWAGAKAILHTVEHQARMTRRRPEVPAPPPRTIWERLRDDEMV